MVMMMKSQGELEPIGHFQGCFSHFLNVKNLWSQNQKRICYLECIRSAKPLFLLAPPR